MVSSSGDAAKMSFYALVNDGYETQQVLTNNTATWFSPSLSWLESGSIAATSVFQLVNTIDWDAEGSLDYGDNRYTMQANDSSIDGDSLFSIYGAGGYGGSWTNWCVIYKCIVRYTSDVFLLTFFFCYCYSGFYLSRSLLYTSVDLSLVML